jgi:adenosylcobyric acid synthase
MGFARAADVPVVLVGDIDRGGVIASLVGTQAVLDPDDAAMIKGFLVNRMRGDSFLFADGMAAVAAHTGWAALGLVPFLPDLRSLPAEDAADLTEAARPRPGAKLRIAVPLLPCIANFDDLDALRDEPDVEVMFVESGTPLPRDADAIILPGSKATIADLASLRAEGWDIDLRAHVRAGGRLLGLCGGYQMLGTRIADPEGIEGPPQEVAGLCLLDVQTVLIGAKRLIEVTGRFRGAAFTGYEMHIGCTTGPGTASPLLHFADGRADGAVSHDGRVAGTYVHGLLLGDAARAAWLAGFGLGASPRSHAAEVEAALDAWAAHLERHVDIDRLISLAR